MHRVYHKIKETIGWEFDFKGCLQNSLESAEFFEQVQSKSMTAKTKTKNTRKLRFSRHFQQEPKCTINVDFVTFEYILLIQYQFM
jgi:hypothetical protein